jgi:hypothetical protein
MTAGTKNAQSPSNQNVRGPRAADRRKAKLDEMRRYYPHFSESERIAVVDADCWPAWMRRGNPERGNEGWYE